MKRVFSSPESAEVGLLKSMLEEANIRCLIRNEAASQAFPGATFQPELWVMDDEDYLAAHDLCQNWRHPSAAQSVWTCPRCGERLEGQFSSCWKCGSATPEGS